jgi:dihydroorotate dehydrogenase
MRGMLRGKCRSNRPVRSGAVTMPDDMIRTVRETITDIPIVASGGITDLSGIVDVLAAGSQAVQLCTTIDHNGLHISSPSRLRSPQCDSRR